MQILPNLPYEFNALEPHIDAKTMEIHHDKHHQAYLDKLNKALEGTGLEDKDIKEILKDPDNLPEDRRTAIINNGGGYVNHNLFWEIMTPESKPKPEGKLAEAIDKTFGSFEEFKQQFTDVAIATFGSGWTWLIINKKGELGIKSLPNQDSPIMDGETPILTIDLWEHAYYLKYQNKRPDYIKAWWNVVNWDKVSELFEQTA